MEFYNIVDKNYINLIKRNIIKPRFKLQLLDHQENVIQEITEDISKDSGSIVDNYNQGIRRTCSITITDPKGKFIPDANNGLFWINRKFKLYIGFIKDNISSSDIYWFSQGVYYVSNPQVSHQLSNRTVTIEGIDKFGIFSPELNYNQLQGTYIIPAGTRIYSAIIDILAMDNGIGFPIDPIEPFLDPIYRNEVLPYDVNKSPGSYMSEILIEFANILGCDEYYDMDGRFTLVSGTIDASYESKSSIWDFVEGDTEYMGSTLVIDFNKVINKVRIIGNNLKDSIFIAEAENNNPMSSTSIQNIGLKEYYEENPVIYNQERANDWAKYRLNSLSKMQSYLSMTCSLIPHLTTDNVITITSEYYKYFRERFIIQSINIPLSLDSTIKIDTTNIAQLPYYNSQIGGS